jgi:hypothetical protein
MKVRNKFNYMNFPFYIILLIVPCIIYVKFEILTGSRLEFWRGENTNTDFFTYYRSQLIILSGILLVLINSIYIWKYRLGYKYKNINRIFFVLFIVTILSGLFSKYSDVVLKGFPDRSENIFVLLSYYIIAISCFYFVIYRDQNIKILKIILIAASIIGVIGIFQFYGYNIFDNIQFKKFILPKELYNEIHNIKNKFGKGIIYATLANPNYVGSYYTLVLPISIGMLLVSKKITSIILSSLALIIIWANLLGSMSRAGYMGAFFGFIILIVLLRKLIIKDYKKIILIIIILISVFITINRTSSNSLEKEINRIDIGKETNIIEKNTGKFIINDLDLSNNIFTIEFDNTILKIGLKGKNMTFYDSENNILDIYVKDNKLYFRDLIYKGVQIDEFSKDSMILIKLGNKNIYLSYLNKKLNLVGGNRELISYIEKPKTTKFLDDLGYIAARGYMWSRTFPLLKNRIIYGSGADTFAIYFPQNDPIGKINNFRKINVYVDKPHNFYLQFAVNNGVLALLCLIALIIMLYIKAIKNFKLNYKSINYKNTGFIVYSTLISGLTSYFVASIFNDSIVSVAPTFWLVLGMGLGMGYKLEKLKK